MLSYARGSDLPIREQTIDEALRENVSRLADHEALVAPHQQARFTFRELDAAVQRTARGLSGLGLEACDRIGLWAVNCVEWVLVQLACARTGIVLVNVNPAYRSQDLGFVLRELCARGYLVMKGYDDEPAATARAIDSEGWLRTGDLGTMRPDQYFRITGRAKDMIIRGGENIFPAEVENFLHTHPKIVDVQVAGIPHEKLGEVVVAWIRLRSGEVATAEEIRDFCQGKIAYFKVPQHIRFRG